MNDDTQMQNPGMDDSTNTPSSDEGMGGQQEGSQEAPTGGDGSSETVAPEGNEEQGM